LDAPRLEGRLDRQGRARERVDGVRGVSALYGVTLRRAGLICRVSLARAYLGAGFVALSEIPLQKKA
jgi:hypothetical protein